MEIIPGSIPLKLGENFAPLLFHPQPALNVPLGKVLCICLRGDPGTALSDPVWDVPRGTPAAVVWDSLYPGLD